MRILLCLLVVLGARHAPAWAEPPADVAALVRQAESRALASEPYWFALLHYQPKASGGVASDIISPEFFLAPNGATNPAAELAATLTALFRPPGDQPDEHAQCRFIARYKWLRRSLDWGALQPPPVECRQYAAYSANDQIESLSLVYATGYLSNPASFYGHILLKFNARRAVVASELLDQSVNYGAVIPNGENPLKYVLKGLFGGYDATFSHQQYFSFNHAYVENDLRDMWEYELRLTADEVDQIVSHSWELLGRRYVYYFIKENCAYRMTQLLELVAGKPLLPELPWSLPGAVFERLARLERDGAPVVRQVRRIPSRQSRFRDRFAAMSEEQQTLAVSLVQGTLDFGLAAYRKLSDAGKTAVVDTLIDYYEYRTVIDRSDGEMRRAKQKLLIERATLPVRQAGADGASSPDAAPPHEGPLPFMIRLGPVTNSRSGGGMKFGLRPANYDSLALDAGRIPSSILTMFDLEVVHLDDRLRLRRLGLVRVENPNLATTPLPADGGWAWRFAVSFESQDLACSSCTVLRAMAGAGRSLALTRRLVGFATVDLSAQAPREGAGTLAAGPRIGLIASPARGWKTQLEVGRQVYLDGARPEHPVARWENRFGDSRHWDVRLGYEENVAREYFAGVSLYW